MCVCVCLQGLKTQDYLIGSIGVSGKTKWDVLDGVIRRLFKVPLPSGHMTIPHPSWAHMQRSKVICLLDLD